MSIEKYGSFYIPTCDFCGSELPEEYDFSDAVKAKINAGWRSVKDEYGWSDACPDCASQMGLKQKTAAEDFAGLGI